MAAKAEQALRLLGLAARAGALVPGTDRVREAVRNGGVAFVLVAADASANSRDKLGPLLDARGVAFLEVFYREELGAAVGRAPLSAVGLTDRSFADRVRTLVVETAEGPATTTASD
jgi:ribosomal protein L7Ae-like RNA K-turn-binding protein